MVAHSGIHNNVGDLLKSWADFYGCPEFVFDELCGLAQTRLMECL